MDEFEGSIKERYKDARIRIDHYSWPEKSSYRFYEKEYYNKLCQLKLAEIMLLKEDFDLKCNFLRIIVGSMRVDPDNLPEHTSWDDYGEFEKEALKALFEIVKTDRKITQEDALKLARKARDKARTSKNKKRKEIYDRIVFELVSAIENEFDDLKKRSVWRIEMIYVTDDSGTVFLKIIYFCGKISRTY